MNSEYICIVALCLEPSHGNKVDSLPGAISLIPIRLHGPLRASGAELRDEPKANLRRFPSKTFGDVRVLEFRKYRKGG